MTLLQSNRCLIVNKHNSFVTTKSLSSSSSSTSQTSFSSFVTTPDLSSNESNSNQIDELTLKKNIEKANVLKEILTSEQKYINDIKEIVEVIIFL
jgi:hypothetical protein